MAESHSQNRREWDDGYLGRRPRGDHHRLNLGTQTDLVANILRFAAPHTVEACTKVNKLWREQALNEELWRAFIPEWWLELYPDTPAQGTWRQFFHYVEPMWRRKYALPEDAITTVRRIKNVSPDTGEFVYLLALERWPDNIALWSHFGRYLLFFRTGPSPRAEAAFRRALELAGEDPKHMAIMALYIRHYSGQRDVSEANQLLDRVFQADIRHLGDTAARFARNGNRALFFKNLEDSEMFFYGQLCLAEEAEDAHAKSDALSNLAHAHWLIEKEEEALKVVEEALALSREYGNRRAESKALCVKGRIYTSRSDFVVAVQCLDAHYKYVKIFGDKHEEAQARLHLGEALIGNKSFAYAVKIFEAQLKYNTEEENRPGEIESMKTLGKAFLYSNDAQRSRHYYEMMLEYSKKTDRSAFPPNRRSEAEALRGLGDVATSVGDFTRAVRHFQDSMNIFKELELNNKVEESQLYESIANVYDRLHDYPRAIENFLESYNLSKLVGERRTEARAAMRVSFAYRKMNNGKMATQYAEEGLKVAVAIRNHELQEACWRLLGEIALYTTSNYPSAKDSFEKALDHAQARKHLGRRAKAMDLYLLGETHRRLCNDTLANEFLRHCVSLSNEYNLNDPMGYASFSLAQIAISAENTVLASTHLNKALYIAKLVSDRMLETMTLTTLGYVHINNAEFTNAHEVITRARTIAVTFKNKQLQVDVLLALGHLNAANGESDASLQFFKQAQEMAGAISYQAGLAASLREVGGFTDVQRAMKICEDIGDKRLLAKCQLSYARLLAVAGDQDEALDLVDKAFELARRLDDRETTRYAEKAKASIAQMKSTEQAVRNVQSIFGIMAKFPGADKKGDKENPPPAGARKGGSLVEGNSRDRLPMARHNSMA